MIQPNKYHHPVTKQTATPWEWVNNNMYYIPWFPSLTLWELEAYWFQPVEEENETDWVDKAYEEFCLDHRSWWIDEDDAFREAIYKHLPKQELIPLDVEKIKDEILLLTTSRYTCTRVREAWNYNTMDRDDFIPLWEDDDFMDDIKQILSKYGTTPQKKFTKEDIYKVVWSPIERDSFQAWKSQWAKEILKHLWLLQE